MDKQKKTLLILCILLAVALLGWIGAKKISEKTEAEKSVSSENSISVFSAKEDDITEVSYDYNGQQIRVIREDETWQDETGETLDEDKVSAMLNYLETITASDVIKNSKEISQYGFDSPTNIVTVKTGDTTTTLTLGAQNSITEKYYLLLNDDESKVYVVDSSILTACGYGTDDLLPEKEEASETDASSENDTTENGGE